MKRSINDILNGPIQGQAGIEWAHELQWAVREALKMVFTRDEMIVEYMKERDALQAKLDAVPVEAIIAYRANSDESEGLIRSGKHDDFVDFDKATEALDEWIITQVQP